MFETEQREFLHPNQLFAKMGSNPPLGTEVIMAKITRYKRDTLGSQMLSISAVVIIVWLAVAGLNVNNPTEASQGIQEQLSSDSAVNPALLYYLGIPVAGYLWGLANYDRTPRAYKSRRMAGFISLIQGSALGFLVWLFLFASRNQELLSELLLGG